MVRSSVWKTRIQQLRKYKDVHGHCRVPQGWSENPNLANWVSQQRYLYGKRQKGEKSAMTEERIEELDTLGFQWSLRPSPSGGNISWQTNFRHLKEYKQANGHCRVPRGWSENTTLANWVNRQRKQYAKRQKGEKSVMTEERIVELEGLGFEWKLSRGGSRKKTPESGSHITRIPVPAEEEGGQQDEVSSATMELEEWKKLIESEEIKDVDIQKIQKQWMDLPKGGGFINWKDDDIVEGRTMLLCALYHKRWDIAKLLLLDHDGTDVTIADKWDCTALMYAACYGNFEIVQLLVEKGADITSVNEFGWTVFMHAAVGGDMEIVEFLLEKGADSTIVSPKGETALSVARTLGHTELVHLLSNKKSRYCVAV